MKTYLTPLILILFICFDANAQNKKDDVFYLKNGSIYGGTIIEHIPNVHYRLNTGGISEITIPDSTIKKIRKERQPKSGSKYIYGPSRPHFEYENTGYFTLIEGHAGAQSGFDIVVGYKFGQFGSLGIGFGFTAVVDAPGANTNQTKQPYFPIFLYYSGDILQKKITPYYCIYGGYGFSVDKTYRSAYDPGGGGNSSYETDGPMGGFGFGARFYSLRRVNVSLGLNLTIQNAKYWNSGWNLNFTYGPNGYQYVNTTYSYSSGSVFMFLPSFSFLIGF